MLIIIIILNVLLVFHQHFFFQTMAAAVKSENKEEAKKPIFYYAYAPLTQLGKKIVDFATEKINPDHLLDDKDVHPDPIERDTHITVFFKLPHKNVSEELLEQAALLGPINFRLGGLGVFETRDKKFDDGSVHSFDVVYIKVNDTNEELKNLHALFGESFGVPASEEEYPYKPHLTVAYQVKGTGKATVELAEKLGLFKNTVTGFSEVKIKQFRRKLIEGEKVPDEVVVPLTDGFVEQALKGVKVLDSARVCL